MSKPKTIDISGVKYSMCAELNENHNFLERLVDAGKIGKVILNGSNYYEVEATKRVVAEMRTIPAGYVRAVDHAILLGSDAQTASALCNQQGAPAKKVQVNNTKPAWFVDKAWLEKHLGKTVKPAPTPAPAVTAPSSIVTANITSDTTIKELQATIAELRTAIQHLASGGTKGVGISEAAARGQGFRPLVDLAKELEVDKGTLRGWGNRGAVRAFKIGHRLWLNVEDCERMYLKLDENRSLISGRMGGRTNNDMHHRPNGVSS